VQREISIDFEELLVGHIHDQANRISRNIVMVTLSNFTCRQPATSNGLSISAPWIKECPSLVLACGILTILSYLIA